jgi:hypothetical protein
MLLDLRHFDRKCEAPQGRAMMGQVNPNGRLVSFGFFVERRRRR